MDGLIGAGLGLLGMINQRGQERRQFNNQVKLMDKQYRNQWNLNEQGHRLGYEMWKKTSYKPQVDEMLKAGINPALMYGMSGGGGQTASSPSGGGASGGTAPMPMPMEIGAMSDALKAKAEKELIDAQTAKVQAETQNIEEVQNPKGSQEIKKLINETENEKLKSLLIKYQTETESYQKEKLINETSKIWEEGKLLNKQNEITRETMDDVIKGVAQDTIGKIVTNELERKKINLTEQQTSQLKHKILQDWIKVGLEGAGTFGNIITKALESLTNKK